MRRNGGHAELLRDLVHSRIKVPSPLTTKEPYLSCAEARYVRHIVASQQPGYRPKLPIRAIEDTSFSSRCMQVISATWMGHDNRLVRLSVSPRIIEITDLMTQSRQINDELLQVIREDLHPVINEMANKPYRRRRGAGGEGGEIPPIGLRDTPGTTHRAGCMQTSDPKEPS